MKTSTFIQASAEVTQITSFAKGNVYKRLIENTYGDDKLAYGIVLDVLSNGDDTAIQVIEFQPSYRVLDTKITTFGGGSDLKVFPANEDELRKYLDECVGSLKKEVATKAAELAEARTKLAEATDVVNGELVKRLSTPAFSDGTKAATTPAPALPVQEPSDDEANLDGIPF